MEHEYEIINNEKAQQLEIDVNGKKAILVYRFSKGNIVFMHTTVPENFEGKGFAGSLARAAFAYAEQIDKPVIVYCPFVLGFLQKHEAYKKQLASN